MNTELKSAWNRLDLAINQLASNLAEKHGSEVGNFMSSELCSAIDVLDEEVELLCPTDSNPLSPDPLISKHLNNPAVKSRNFIQNCGRFHPYTCGNHECRAKTGGAPLLAVKNGWFCEECAYFQPL